MSTATIKTNRKRPVAIMAPEQLKAFMTEWYALTDKLEEVRESVRKHGVGKHAFGTVYRVKAHTVRAHERKAFVAVRLPFRRAPKTSNA